MKRWVGLGVISDNLINIGRVISEKPSEQNRDLFPNDSTRGPARPLAGLWSFRDTTLGGLLAPQITKCEFCAGK
jgi:hypothetical protein